MRKLITGFLILFLATAVCSATSYLLAESTDVPAVSNRLSDTITENARIKSSDFTPHDEFGYTVGMSGNRIVVGAPAHEVSGSYSGAAYIFTDTSANGNWSSFQETKLTSPDAAANDEFGKSVDISGDVAIVGAYYDQVGSIRCGSAYIFRFNGSSWAFEAKLNGSARQDGDGFGWPVVIEGDTAVVMTQYTIDAYIFRRVGSSWVEETRVPSIGAAAAIDGDTVVLGKGARIIILRRGGAGWSQLCELSYCDYGYFCSPFLAVAIDGKVMVVGVPYYDNYKGGAIVFQDTSANGDWSSTSWAKLTASDANDYSNNQLFGISVAVSGARTVIGAQRTNYENGAAYLFQGSGEQWWEENKLIASDPGSWDYFGREVSIEGNTVLVGQCMTDPIFPGGSGAAYIYNLPPAQPTPTPPSRGADLDFDGDGTSDIGIFRPASGLWAVRSVTRAYFGGADDLIVPGDYNGDGTSDIGIFRTASGLWAIQGVTRAYFGGASDLPVPGDYDGDGTADVGIYRTTSGLWAIQGVTRAYFGGTTDEPVPGYYNGDSSKDIGIFRGGSGLWAVKGITRAYFGSSSDDAMPGDYDGDGAWEIGIFRTASGMWAIRGVTRAYFGSSADDPLTADYAGNGIDDIGIFRPGSSLWAIRGLTRAYFGGSSDIPVTR